MPAALHETTRRPRSCDTGMRGIYWWNAIPRGDTSCGNTSIEGLSVIEMSAQRAGVSSAELMKRRLASMPKTVGLPRATDASERVQTMRFRAAFANSQMRKPSDGQRQMWSSERKTDQRGGSALCCRTTGPVVFETTCCPPVEVGNPVRCGTVACKKPIISSQGAAPRCCSQN